MTGTTIARATEKQAARPTVIQLVNSMGPEIQRALPRHLDGDRVARLALTEIRKNPTLGECKPESFVGALLTAAAAGVEVGTPEAYLVPYAGECTLIIGYQGYTKLFWQHPAAQTLNAQTVYEKDEFDYAYGLAPKLHHVPAKGDRGKVIFYYAAVSLSTGGQHFEVLTPEEVKELRGGKVGPDKRFKGGDPMRWMERKTAIRQVLKPMPKSTQMSLAVQSDERDGTDLYMERVAEREPAVAAITAPVPGVDPRSGEVTDPAAARAAGEAIPGEPDQRFFDDLEAGR
jgi:recombination protein RecT